MHITAAHKKLVKFNTSDLPVNLVSHFNFQPYTDQLVQWWAAGWMAKELGSNLGRSKICYLFSTVSNWF
jgi:hypothetical protein